MASTLKSRFLAIKSCFFLMLVVTTSGSESYLFESVTPQPRTMNMRERYALKCPSCGEEALIQRGDVDYECIHCGYKKHLTSDEVGTGSFLILGFILFLIMMAILQDYYRNQYTPSDYRSPSSDSIFR
jgi:predicted RNA-binding Zn-ribbon protein involved in translation (DUF1610 family)